MARVCTPDGFASRWKTICGLRLHALESAGGRGAPAVLLPGLVTASRSMIPLARPLAGRGLRVWILDTPGFAYSDKPRRTLSTGEQAALVAEWLAATGCQPARVLGNSFGSQLASAVAAGYPAIVERSSCSARPSTRRYDGGFPGCACCPAGPRLAACQQGRRGGGASGFWPGCIAP